MVRVWLDFFCEDGGSLRSSIEEALARVEIDTYALPTEANGTQGIIFFDQVTRRLCDFVKEATRGGINRLLAVAFSSSVLAHGEVWALVRAGATDVFAWDHSSTPAEEIAARLVRWEEVDRFVDLPLVRDNLVGQNPRWRSLLRQIVEVARFTDASALIMGETGTGKELVARLIHTLDRRPDKRDLIVLDCTTIVSELSGSEFFGHERGAFTGAVTSRDGAFAMADQGTLFLDEVGELPLTLQAQLLRVIQERTYKRVGGSTWLKTDFRLVCATNRDLLKEVEAGRFRSDLYYRIANWLCKLPPLRERVDDVIPLSMHFLKEFRKDQEPQEKAIEMDELVRAYLLQRDYPGNIRDLRQLLSRIFHRHVGPGPITLGDLPEEERPPFESKEGGWRDTAFEQTLRRALSLGIGLKEIGRAAEETAERIAVQDEEGNLQRAASRLGITDRALQMRRASRRQNGTSQKTDEAPL